MAIVIEEDSIIGFVYQFLLGCKLVIPDDCLVQVGNHILRTVASLRSREQRSHGNQYCCGNEDHAQRKALLLTKIAMLKIVKQRHDSIVPNSEQNTISLNADYFFLSLERRKGTPPVARLHPCNKRMVEKQRVILPLTLLL